MMVLLPLPDSPISIVREGILAEITDSKILAHVFLLLSALFDVAYRGFRKNSDYY